MKTYAVTFQVEVTCTIQVQAENEESAWDEANENFNLADNLSNLERYHDAIIKVEEFFQA